MLEEMSGGKADCVNVEDIRRLRSNMKAQRNRSYRPCWGPCMGIIRSLKGSRRAACRKNTGDAVARSLKTNVDGAEWRNTDMGRSFPMWTRRRCIRRGMGRRIPPVTSRKSRTLVRLMRLSSSPSMYCASPTCPTVELRPNSNSQSLQLTV